MACKPQCHLREPQPELNKEISFEANSLAPCKAPLAPKYDETQSHKLTVKHETQQASKKEEAPRTDEKQNQRPPPHTQYGHESKSQPPPLKNPIEHDKQWTPFNCHY
jgi:hypothetical protein